MVECVLSQSKPSELYIPRALSYTEPRFAARGRHV